MTDDDKRKREAQIARIRALMAKTTANGCTEGEAQAAAAAVDMLLEKYEIDLEELVLREQTVILHRIKDAGRHHAVRFAGTGIAHFTDCRWRHSGNDYMFLGFEVDTEIAEYLVLLFRRAIDRECQTFTIFNQEYDALRAGAQRDMLLSFQTGMATRLGERLSEMKSKRDFSVRSQTGRDLVPVKRSMVDEMFLQLGIKLGRITYASGSNLHGHNAGREAGEKVPINPAVKDYSERRGAIR